MLLDHLQDLGDDIGVLRLVQNARNVEHAVLEELDRDFLFRLKSVPAGQQHQRHGVVTEPRVLLGLLGLDASTDLIP